MKILLVNNNTRHLKNLRAQLFPHEVEVLMYKPGVEFNCQDKDLVILSGGGGQGNEINDTADLGKLWYNDEMEFVLGCDKPVIGICMGFEVIARAYGSKVEEMDKLVQGFKSLSTTAKGKINLRREKLRQYEAHKWRVEKVSTKEFDILAESPTGIEIIKHKKYPVLATQFHPEKGGTVTLKQLANAPLY